MSSGQRLRAVVIAADLAPNANLTPSQFSLFAANRASLDVLGDITVKPLILAALNFGVYSYEVILVPLILAFFTC